MSFVGDRDDGIEPRLGGWGPECDGKVGTGPGPTAAEPKGEALSRSNEAVRLGDRPRSAGSSGAHQAGHIFWVGGRSPRSLNDLTPRMVSALLEIFEHPRLAHTCTTIGQTLTRRRSSFGHQTSAREGGRTLMALRRRELVYDRSTDDGLLRVWKLTPKGAEVAETLKGTER